MTTLYQDPDTALGPAIQDTPRRSTTGRPTVCLCMIVKNESAVIERCLASVRGLIDTWVIDDSGSTDATPELVRAALAGIPGELHHEPWVDFGHNRTRNIERARGRADYLLLIDADMVLRLQPGRTDLGPLDADSYMISHTGDLAYRNKRLVRADLPWRYEGSTHEYLTCEGERTPADLDTAAVDHRADGGSRHDKFERDAALLRRDLERDPDNARTVFYLAQTLRDMGRTREAVALYERRAAMGGWAEEVYYALLQQGVLTAETGDWTLAMPLLIRAWEYRPQRLEACYELVSRLRLRGEYNSAQAFVRAALDRPVPTDWLFVHPWVHRWGLLFEHSITAYWTGDHAGSLHACDRLLRLPDLPETYREQTVANRAYAVEALSRSATAVLPAPGRAPGGAPGGRFTQADAPPQYTA